MSPRAASLPALSRRARLLAVLSLLAPSLLGGCKGEPAGPGLVVGPPERVLPFDHPPVDFGVDGGVSSAAARRLSVAQLQASIAAVLGDDVSGNPITWKVGNADGFDSRAATLGVPNFISVSEETLEPSPLYLKFMSDMARDVCNRAVAADAVRTTPSTRVLQRFVGLTDTLATRPAAVDENLRYLKLRFHGVKVADTDTEAVASLRALFDATVRGAAGTSSVTEVHVREGWRTVCVALLTAPEFHLY